MPETMTALLVLAFALLPGGLYTWAFERAAGQWQSQLADRTLRLIGTSAVLIAFWAWPAYELWRKILHHPVDHNGTTIYENRLWEGSNLHPLLYLAPLTYVALPVALGMLVGHATTRRHDGNRIWATISTIGAGPSPAPTAWDHLFLRRPHAVIRAKLTTGQWIGGLFSQDSYAAGYGEAGQDLLLEQRYAMTSDGQFVPGDNDNDFNPLGSAVLIKRQDTQFIEIFQEQP